MSGASERVVVGPAECDPGDGAPLRFTHPAAPALPYLLDERTEPWHGLRHRWGSGFVIVQDPGADGSDGQRSDVQRSGRQHSGRQHSGRWNQPIERDWDSGGNAVRLAFEPLPQLRLEVERRAEDRTHSRTGSRTDGRTGGRIGADGTPLPSLVERYRWTNRSARPLRLGSLGISLPIRDLYVDSTDALTSACHAHVFTGGAWSWLLAEPMSGSGPLLGLVVREGGLWAYSVESRNSRTSSNVRGHLVVHPTDRARNPDAFGGQPDIVLQPEETLRLAWTVGWYTDRAQFLADTDPPVELPQLAVPLNESLRVRPRTGVRVASDQAEVAPTPDGESELTVRGSRHGVAYLRINDATTGAESRTAIAFHYPIRELVELRVRVLLDRHRPWELPEPDRYAFVPRDTETGLTQPTSGWMDWTDGAERLGMPALLQQARLRGWGNESEIDQALRHWAWFARTRLLDEDGTVHRDSAEVEHRPRLYNFPWMAHFFADQYRLYRDERDLDTAARVLERSYQRGAAGHLSIGQPEAVLLVSDLLDQGGDSGRADRLRSWLSASALSFARAGDVLPSHEVNYEQSMVAPLVSLLALVHQRWPDPRLAEALVPAVRWLLAFGGPQPHVRLKDIGIRHWDGFWFGRNRQWGDVFPHHWSVLSAVACAQLPDELSDDSTRKLVDAVFRANTLNITADGEGTCAFVLPSCVDGVPGYRADPLANDQDWALTLWLRTTG